MTTENKKNRRQQILEALAMMLESSPGSRITTAALAKEVGVSEAALYRHFPSKSKMFEGLIEFIETTIFSQITLVMSNEISAIDRCEKSLYILLLFCERNPGISRLLNGDALTGETDRLRARIAQLYDRLETQLRQTLRDAELREGTKFGLSVNATTNLMLTAADGRVSQFVRSEFKRKPTELWAEQWKYLMFGCYELAN
ncbi:MAG: TetR/AcrR family transcriptional regulator [Flavobacteriales bacterium]|jgi:TetR/AcrR family transcriptional regulator